MRAGRIGAVLAAVLLAAGCAGSAAVDADIRASAEAEIARRPADYTNGEARAWLIRRDGAERGLLWGTVHVGYGRDTVLPAPIRQRFYAASDLTVETVLDRLPKAEAEHLRTLFHSANHTADPAALRRLDPMTRQALQQALPDESPDRYSLRGLAMLVAARALAEPPGALPVVGFVDINLIAFARSQGCKVLGLESPKTPDPTLADPNGADAAALLQLDLRRADEFHAMGRWVREAYGRGEVALAVAALHAWRATHEDLARDDRDRHALLTSRNQAWLPRLERILDSPGEHFIAVGAGHLLGQDGLVTLLTERGYQVTPCLNDVCG